MGLFKFISKIFGGGKGGGGESSNYSPQVVIQYVDREVYVIPQDQFSVGYGAQPPRLKIDKKTKKARYAEGNDFTGVLYK